MRKISYEVNPSKVFEIKEFKELSLAEKGAYLEMVNLAWATEDQYKFAMDADYLSLELGVSKSGIECLISNLIDMGICYLEMDLDSGKDNLVFKDLERQMGEFRNKKTCEIIDVTKIIESKKDSLSKRVVNCEKINHPEIMYLKEGERDLSFYQGWMPTINFNVSGQVYVLPAQFLSNLADTYPNINLREHLGSMFNWMAYNSEKRKPVGRIAEFITRWCEKASMKTAVSENEMSSLLAKISQHL